MWGKLQNSVCLVRLCGGLSQSFHKNNSIRFINNCINAKKWVLSKERSYFYSENLNFSTNVAVEEQNGPNIMEITGGDSELESKLKILILEADVMRQEGRLVPEILKDWHWKELLNFSSRSARIKYLQYLFKTEKAKENDKIKKEHKRLSRLELIEQPIEDDGHIKYGLNDNNIFLRIYDSTINQLYNNNLVQAMQFGQKLVVDCSYDEFMTQREAKNCAKQLMLLFAENRAHVEPFDLHYHNFNKSGATALSLHRHIKTMYEPWFPLNIHESNYLEFFPKEKLVYLTPHCREELTEFDHDAVYIIGAMVDKINNEPVSLAKAKANNLKMAKLPLDHYLQWGSGSGKSLTLNQMISILLDVKKTGNWELALKHVPRRKLENYSNPTMKTPSRSTFTAPKLNAAFNSLCEERTVSEEFVSLFKSKASRDKVLNDFKKFNRNSSLTFKDKRTNFSFANRKTLSKLDEELNEHLKINGTNYVKKNIKD